MAGRRILFRAWDKLNNLMIDDFHDSWHWDNKPLCGRSESDRYNVMQYSGRKAVDGRMIFEGDVVLCNHLKKEMVIYYCCEYAQFKMRCGSFKSVIQADIEVIGNIYEQRQS